MKKIVCAIVALAALLLFLSPAAAKPFKIPPHAGQSSLTLEIVGYRGGTNGALTVRVTNAGKKDAVFVAQGLAFVPNMDPDKAPQRLGAVGPFRRASGDDPLVSMTLRPGAQETVVLDVFCIDSHRPSPSPATPFRLARKRLPANLTQVIERENASIAEDHGGYDKPAAKSAIQQNVWKNRDQDWVRIEGEGKQEAGK